MRKHLLHVLIISFVFLFTPTVQAASDVEEEIESRKQAIRINPDDAKAHFSLRLSGNGCVVRSDIREVTNRGNRLCIALKFNDALNIIPNDI